jgi:hypothetical protein
MGVAQVIAGIGTMILPIILQKLIEKYGFRGTQAIISAISLHSLLCAAVQRPVEKHQKHSKPVTVFRQECDYVDFDMTVVDGKPGTLHESRRESPDLGARNVNVRPETLDESHDMWESPNTEMRITNGKPETLKASHDDTREYSKLETRVNGKPETLQESQTRDAMEGVYRYAFLHRDESETCEMIKEVIPTGDSKPSNADVTNMHVKSQTLATTNMHENTSPVSASHVENVNDSNSTANLNGVVNNYSEVSEQSQIIVVNNDDIQNVHDEDDEDEDSAKTHLLRDEFVKERYPPDRTSPRMGSITTENQVSIIDLRATVASLRSRASSCERRCTEEEASMSKCAVNTEAPNM